MTTWMATTPVHGSGSPDAPDASTLGPIQSGEDELPTGSAQISLNMSVTAQHVLANLKTATDQVTECTEAYQAKLDEDLGKLDK